MNRRIRVVGIGALLAIMAAMGAMTASASTGGHFTSDSPTGSTIVTAVEEGTHRSEMVVPGLTGIVCDETLGEATVTGSTVTEVKSTGTAKKCKTTGGTAGETIVHQNGCWGIATIGLSALKHNTGHLECPAGKSVEITHQGCLIKIPPQTGTGAIFKTTVINGKHAITGEGTTSGTVHFEAGFCVLLGTTKTATITGSGIIKGFEDVGGGVEGNQVNITATGSED